MVTPMSDKALTFFIASILNLLGIWFIWASVTDSIHRMVFRVITFLLGLVLVFEGMVSLL